MMSLSGVTGLYSQRDPRSSQPYSKYDTTPEEFLSTLQTDLSDSISMGSSSNMEFLADAGNKNNCDDDEEYDYDDQGSTCLAVSRKQEIKKMNTSLKDETQAVPFSKTSGECENNMKEQMRDPCLSRPSSIYDTTPEEFLLSGVSPSSTIEFLSDYDDDDDNDQGSAYNEIKEEFRKMNTILKNEIRPIMSSESSEEYSESWKEEMSTLSNAQDMLRLELAKLDEALSNNLLSDYAEGGIDDNDQDSTYYAIKVAFRKMNSPSTNEMLPSMPAMTSGPYKDGLTEEMRTLSHVQEMLREELAMVKEVLNIESLSDYDEDDYGDDQESTFNVINEEFRKMSTTLRNEMRSVLSSKTSEEYEDGLTEEMNTLSHAQEMLRQELAMADQGLFLPLPPTSSWVSEDEHREVSTVYFPMNISLREQTNRPEQAEEREDPPSECSMTCADKSIPPNCPHPRELLEILGTPADDTTILLPGAMERALGVSQKLAGGEVLQIRTAELPILKNPLFMIAKAPMSPDNDWTFSEDESTSTAVSAKKTEVQVQIRGIKSPMSEASHGLSCTVSFPTPSSAETEPSSSSTDFWGNVIGVMDKWFVAGEEPEPQVEDENDSLWTDSSTQRLSTISEGNETKSKLSVAGIKSVASELNEFIEIFDDLRIETNTGGMGERHVIDSIARVDTLQSRSTLYHDAVQSFASDPTVDIMPTNSLSPQSDNHNKPPRSPSKSPCKSSDAPRSSKSQLNLQKVAEGSSKISNAFFHRPTEMEETVGDVAISEDMQTKKKYQGYQPSKSKHSEQDRELIGKVILPRSPAPKKLPHVHLTLQSKEPSTSHQAEVFTRPQRNKNIMSIQLPNPSSPKSGTEAWSPRTQCSSRSEKTTVSEASARGANETLRYELQMIESMDLRSEGGGGATSTTSPRSQETPEQIIKTLEIQLDVYQELETIKAKLLAVKTRASPRASELNVPEAPRSRALDLQLSTSDHGEIVMSRIPIQPMYTSATISPLHSLRSPSMEYLTARRPGDKADLEFQSPVDSLLLESSSEEGSKPLLKNEERGIDDHLHAQVVDSSSDSSQHRTKLDLILQETKASLSDSAAELIDLGTFRFENDAEIPAHVQSDREKAGHADDEESITESITQTLARIYLRSQVGTEIQETPSRMSHVAVDDCSVSRTIERIAQRVAQGELRHTTGGGSLTLSKQQSLQSNLAHMSDNLKSMADNIPSRSSSGVKDEVGRCLDSVLDWIGVCGTSQGTSPEPPVAELENRNLIVTQIDTKTSESIDNQPLTVTRACTSLSESIDSEYPVSTRTTSLMRGANNVSIQENIDIFVTCISHKPPTLPLREELAGIGVELVLHDPTNHQQQKEVDQVIDVDEIEPTFQEKLEMQAQVEHARKKRHKKRFRRLSSPTHAPSTLPLSPANPHRHQFYDPNEQSQPTSAHEAAETPVVAEKIRLDSLVGPTTSGSNDEELRYAADTKNRNPKPPLSYITIPPPVESKSFLSPVVEPQEDLRLSSDPMMLLGSMTSRGKGSPTDQPTDMDRELNIDSIETKGQESQVVIQLLNCNERLLQSMVDFDYSTYCGLTSPDLTGIQVGIPGCQTLKEGTNQKEEHFRRQTGHVLVRMVNPMVRFLSPEVAVITYLRIDHLVGDRVARQWDETRIWERPGERRRANGETREQPIETNSTPLWINCHFHQSTQTS